MTTTAESFKYALPDNEALLRAWLRLSTCINNSRIVSAMSYNESLVCNILYSCSKAGRAMTATALCNATRMLKSQMNRTLNLLESKGMILRERSASDKRQVLITFNMAHAEQYEKQHKEILSLIDHITGKLGKDESRYVIDLLSKIADIADDILH
jgi:DNA-binding MarR family transcriptional regulator